MVRKLHAHSKAQQAYDTLDQMEKTKLEKLIGSCSESDLGVPGQYVPQGNRLHPIGP